MIGEAMKAAFGMANVFAKVGMAAGGKLAKTALKHPGMTIMEVGGSLALYGLAKSGAQDSRMTSKQIAMQAYAQGTPSSGFAPGESYSRNAWIESTQGLTNGLWRARHG